MRIAVCQILVIDSDREGNFRRITHGLEAAHAQRADIAAFPESSILGWQNPDAHVLARPIPGADSNRISALARRYSVMVAIGLDEREGSNLYDSAILVDKTGKLLWRYRKLEVMPELMSPPYARGKASGIGVVETEFGRIGTLICADTFSDKYAEKLATLKPDLVLVPYGWAAPVGRWPAHKKNLEKLVIRRAKQWGCPVVGTDVVGQITHGPWKGYTFGGASVVADGSGKAIAVLRDRDVEVNTVDLMISRHMRE